MDRGKEPPQLTGVRYICTTHASASLSGLTMTNLSRANLCRAVVEGTTFGLQLDPASETLPVTDNVQACQQAYERYRQHVATQFEE